MDAVLQRLYLVDPQHFFTPTECDPSFEGGEDTGFPSICFFFFLICLVCEFALVEAKKTYLLDCQMLQWSFL